MKILITLLTLFLSTSLFAQIVYYDNNDAVYTVPSSTAFHEFDLNQDGTNDIDLNFLKITQSYSCGGFSSSAYDFVRFRALGSNKLNTEGGGTNPLTIDCSNDTLDIFDDWTADNALIYEGIASIPCFPITIGEGTHKQGFRLVVPNGQGGNGYQYGYIDYSVTNNGDIVIHGWYYESSLNVPIDVNTQIDYPYNSNCIVYDTTFVTVNDTVTYTDTLYTTVTDTLYIDVNSAGQNSQLLSTLKVYPNPTNSIITIDNGNYSDINDYSLSVVSQQGQQVFTSPINQQTFTVDLSDFGSSGLYYLHIINSNAVIVDTRKIVLF